MDTKTLQVIGVIRRGRRVTAVLVTSDSPAEFEEAFAGRRIRPIIVTAIPVQPSVNLGETVHYEPTEPN